MDPADFNRRIRALKTRSRVVPAARDVLVNGEGLRASADRHSVDPGNVARLVRQLKAVRLCPECGQPRK